ncbi:MAG TPA: dipeptidase PepE [Casimicrobiaceae bacterium]|nr:dipeptidase PepE [Casimicrobiaceae bacterium]
MELLLLSNSTSARGYLVYALDEIEKTLQNPRRAAFVPFASVTRDWTSYAERVAKALAPVGIRIESVHRAVDPSTTVRNADALIVGGGNTFHLLHHCRRTGVLAALGERARAGVPYVGWSAGANLACPTIRTTNDMPVIDPDGFDALGLVPFQINPHFNDEKPAGHFGETRSERLAEFIAVDKATAVLALPEGSWIRLSDGCYTLGGERGAIWMQAGREAMPVGAGPLTVPSVDVT